MNEQTQFTPARYTIGFRSDLTVVGTNPEMADMSNPRGEIIRERWYAIAEDASGNRWRWGWYETAEEAEHAFRAIAPPVAQWEETYPSYGSPAYEQYGEAELVAWEKARG
jgi:hypothetical protein